MRVNVAGKTPSMPSPYRALYPGKGGASNALGLCGSRGETASWGLAAARGCSQDATCATRAEKTFGALAERAFLQTGRGDPASPTYSAVAASAAKAGRLRRADWISAARLRRLQAPSG